MRTRVIQPFTAASVAVALIAALVATEGDARAQQTDTNPPLPNVMLLIDNSGSMERMINGNTPEADVNALTPSGTNQCNCIDQGPGKAPICSTWTQNTAPPSPNRWSIVQQSLTGSLQNGFNCVAMNRTTSGGTFASEYQINGLPYDYNYYLPFHRMVAEDKSSGTGVACVVAPGGLPGAPTGVKQGGPGAVLGLGGTADSYPSGSIVARQYGLLPGYGSGAVACSTSGTNGAVPGFLQYPDGALTTMRDLMRFGMMTFDSDPDPGSGVTSLDTVNSTPFTGMWTYFPAWKSGGADSYAPPPLGVGGAGDPANCTTPQFMAVGARNPGAPPWEGRLVGFPATPDLATQRSNNDEVANVVLASRPYGATPLAGMFAGAEYYYFTDPTGPQQSDNYVKGLCRNEYVILLTDGTPNLDMQPTCSNAGSGQTPSAGTCPFPMPYSKVPAGTAAALYGTGTSTSSQASVKTYVIGFALSDPNNNPVNCSQYAQNGQCNCNDANLPQSVPYGPCCVLECIAEAGGTNTAYFAQSQSDLSAALGSILGQIAQNTTTRTTPAYSSVVTNVLASAQGNQSIYLASFNPSPGLAWSGDIQRQRYVCTASGAGYTIPPPVIDPTQGDDFAVNLNLPGNQRTFIGYMPATVSSTVDATTTIRPFAPTTGADGIGSYGATMYEGIASAIDTLPSSQTTAWQQAMAIPATGCPYTSNGSGTQSGSPQLLPVAACATMLLDFTFGQSTFNGIKNDFTFASRYGNAFGSVYHATPAVIGAPGSLLQDPAYIGFAAAWSTRKTVVYAPTNDGLLHAFWADEPTKANNELWAMLLPGVMPNIYLGSYPSSQSFLLDGPPVVKDVVWERSVNNGTTMTDSTQWHTMLTAGYGALGGGYYGIDVTNPDPTGMVTGSQLPTDPPQKGPVFRWQLTKMPATNMPLFGTRSATPAIATLYMNDPTSNPNGPPSEIGVAILPGGEGTVPSTPTECARWPKASDSAPVGSYAARVNVRCWGQGNPTASPPVPPAYTDFVQGRSVTVVRIDTGEILRVFARQNDMNGYANDTIAKNRFTDTPLDSPMTGTPVVYPNDVGADATKFFIGDADGTIWRFDLSNPDPSKWFGELYLDLYNQTVDTSSASQTWNDGQPIQVPPVLSLDPSGNLVLNLASGTTDQFDTTGVEYIYSITEKTALLPSPKLRAFVNWWHQPAIPDNAPGERVSGPMTVFNGTLYFSTFATALANTQACTNGTARLWGRDFVTPADTTCATSPTTCNRSLGGLPEMPPPSGAQTPFPLYVEPDQYDPTLAGKVIPGVSIKSTPACANLGTPGSDSYVAGAQHSTPQNYTQTGGFSLFTQVGAKGSNGATTKQFQMSVPTPIAPTLIDSWAGVLE